MTLSDFLVRELYNKGVRHVFEVSGGMIANIINSFYNFKKIEVITMHHEQSVSFAVDGYARTNNRPAIGFGTSGPGAINLLTGIGSCYFDSVPAIFFVGQVNSNERKGDKLIRQLGFQETDIASMAKPICKAVYVVENVNQFQEILDEAFNVTMEGRMGPVLIEIPMNLQKAEISVKNNIEILEQRSILNEIDSNIWDDLNKKISTSKKPLILIGRGVNCSSSRKLLVDFAEHIGVPVVASLHGIDVVPNSHPLRIGFIGTYGNRWANLALGECDLLIVLGSRLDIRQTGADTTFFGKRYIFHVDIESAEVNNRVKDCVPIISSLKSFFDEGLKNIKPQDSNKFKIWIDLIKTNQIKYPDTKEIIDCNGINPNIFLSHLSLSSKLAGAFVADVGNHQMWCAQSLKFEEEQFFITSGGMGAMGHCLPASIGICFAIKKPVVSISGDGGFQLNIQELETIYRNKLPIKMIVINNQSLGMIRQFQQSYFNSNYQSTVWGYSCPNFENIAKAYKINALTINKSEDMNIGIKALWENPKEPFLLQVMIDPSINCYPKIAFGKPITEMEPLAKPIAYEGT
jgi:acetolactate synthase-1/2/3 large subunit